MKILKTKSGDLKIKSCESCSHISKQINGNRCFWPHKLPMRNLRRIITFPYWCPLEDADQTPEEFAAGVRALQAGIVPLRSCEYDPGGGVSCDCEPE